MRYTVPDLGYVDLSYWSDDLSTAEWELFDKIPSLKLIVKLDLS